MGPHLHIFFKNHNKMKFIVFFYKKQKIYIYSEEYMSNDIVMIQKKTKTDAKSIFKDFSNL